MKLRNKFRYGAQYPNGVQLWSAVYDDFEECYEAYASDMQALKNMGHDLSEFGFRGVFDLHQAGLLITASNMYVDTLKVTEGEW